MTAAGALRSLVGPTGNDRKPPIAALNKQWSEMVVFPVRAPNRAILPVARSMS